MSAVHAESAPTRLYDGLVRTHGIDQRIADLAERQHGVVARRQLLEMGLGEDALESRCRRGRLHRLHRGVYAVGHTAVGREGRLLAAVFACGPGAVLSHRSAAALWGLRTHNNAAIDVTVPRKSRSSAAIRRHLCHLPRDEVTIRQGIRVTTVPRTIFDFAATFSVDAVESVLRQAEYLRLNDRLSLHDLLDRYPHRRGARRVRACLARISELPPGRTRSPLEERLLPFLRRHRLPRPRLNDWIEVAGRCFEVDCHWPGTGQIVELDGFDAHGTRIAFREDRARDRALRVAGYSVTRIAWAQLDDEPEAIAADLRALLPR